MKKILASGSKYVFAAFSLAILGLLMSLTYQALGRIFPNSLENQIWGLILFDLAAICWALAFVYASETVAQYTAAGLGFLTGLLGTLLMVGAEVILGQTLIDDNQQAIGQWMVYGFIGATALHAILIYAHHAGGKQIRQQIDVGIARGEVVTEAISQATATIDQQRRELAQVIAHDILSQAKRDLGLYPAEGTPFQPTTYEHATPQPRQLTDQNELTQQAHALGMWNPNDPNDSPFWRSDGPDLDKINSQLETVKQDLVTARHMLEQLEPNQPDQEEPGTKPSPFRKSEPE